MLHFIITKTATKMRLTYFIVSCLFISTLSFAQGVKFEEGKWSEIMQKAKTENKIIFMDAYTTWCGPCKMMSKNTFPDAEVGSYYNTNFVNVKMDMEKGEGIQLAMKYGVQAYPTLLFIDADGEIVHRVAGYLGASDFLALGKKANNPAMSMVAMDKKYASGERNADFLYQYMGLKADAMDPSYSNIANEYLRNQGDLGTDRNMEVIMQFVNDPFSEPFAYFLKNKSVFVKKYGADDVEAKAQNSVGTYLQENPELPIGDIEKLFTRVFAADGDRMFSGFKPVFYRQKGDKDGYANASIAHFKKYPSKDAQELNESAWTFYQVIDDKKLLKQAIKWAKKSVKIDNAYYNNDTLAALLFKAGKLKDAKKTAEKAIELAKKTNEDYSETQKLLDQITAVL
jgi:thioredoxin-related protein